LTDILNDINIFHQVGLSRYFEPRSCNQLTKSNHRGHRLPQMNAEIHTKISKTNLTTKGTLEGGVRMEALKKLSNLF